MKSGGEGRFALALKLRKFLGSEKEGGGGGVSRREGKESDYLFLEERFNLV